MYQFRAHNLIYLHLVIFFGAAIFFLLYFVNEAWAQTLTQNAYRFYVNTDAVQPTDPWPAGSSNLGENTPITLSNDPPASGEVIRIRLTTQVSVANLAAGQTFKLQFGEGTICSAIVTWTDVGAIGGAGIWRGRDNPTPADGATITTLLLTPSDVAETYEEQNNSATTPNPISIGQDGEWDWVVEDNGATAETSYCFRMVKGDGTVLSSYLDYPKLTTSGYRARSQNWRFYNDETSETPVTALAAETVSPQISDNEIFKLRLTLKDTANVAGTDIKFKTQYSQYSDFSQGVTDVVASGSCVSASLWCYADGVDLDNAAIITRLLTDSTASGTHNETGTSASTFDPVANTATEFEFTLKHGGPAATRTGGTYFFRAYNVTKDIPVLTNTGETYPSLSTAAASLTFTIGGLASGTVTEGITTDVTTTATTVPFGTLTLATDKEAAQRLTVTTNATEGYKIFVFQRQALKLEGYTTVVPAVTGTNASPTAWATGCVSSATGCVGYHAGDDTLSGGSTRFSANDTWAQLETTTQREIAYASGPVTSEVNDIVFRLKATALQSAGPYNTTIVYVVVPIH